MGGCLSTSWDDDHSPRGTQPFQNHQPNVFECIESSTLEQVANTMSQLESSPLPKSEAINTVSSAKYMDGTKETVSLDGVEEVGGVTAKNIVAIVNRLPAEVLVATSSSVGRKEKKGADGREVVENSSADCEDENDSPFVPMEISPNARKELKNQTNQTLMRATQIIKNGEDALKHQDFAAAIKHFQKAFNVAISSDLWIRAGEGLFRAYEKSYQLKEAERVLLEMKPYCNPSFYESEMYRLLVKSYRLKDAEALLKEMEPQYRCSSFALEMHRLLMKMSRYKAAVKVISSYPEHDELFIRLDRLLQSPTPSTLTNLDSQVIEGIMDHCEPKVRRALLRSSLRFSHFPRESDFPILSSLNELAHSHARSALLKDVWIRGDYLDNLIVEKGFLRELHFFQCLGSNPLMRFGKLDTMKLRKCKHFGFRGSNHLRRLEIYDSDSISLHCPNGMPHLQHLTIRRLENIDREFVDSLFLPNIEHISLQLPLIFEFAILRLNLRNLYNLRSLEYSHADSGLNIFDETSIALRKLESLSLNHNNGEDIICIHRLNTMLSKTPNLRRLRLANLIIEGIHDDQGVLWPHKLKHLDLRAITHSFEALSLPRGLESLILQRCSPFSLDDTSNLKNAVLDHRFDPDLGTRLMEAGFSLSTESDLESGENWSVYTLRRS